MSTDNTPPSLSAEQKRKLEDVLNVIVPPNADRKLPGAGQAGLVEPVTELLQKSPELVEMIAAGLSDLGPAFASLSLSEKSSRLNALAADQPGFLPLLIFHTYSRYYLQPEVVEALGLEARPPYPKGYEMEANDLSLLDPVRAASRRGEPAS